MEKVLKLYTYVDGVNDTPFPNEEQQVIVSDFRSDYKRMGAVPTISCTVMHPLCLDKLWTDNVYATFNGERFFIKQTATSSFDNTDARYKHEVELVSERIMLDNVYFFDVVSDSNYDKPVSNNTSFTFFGDIHEFANRLNYSLQYSKLGYSVVVDDGITSEGKLISVQDQFFSSVLQESYNTYEIPYYFVGKVIHIGYADNIIDHVFKYGRDESLLSIQKQNANYKIVNRITGFGSVDNVPYYYPNFDERGVYEILFNDEKDQVEVTSRTKFDKVHISDVFSYKQKDEFTQHLLGDYKLGYVVAGVDSYEDTISGEWVTVHQFQLTYSFSIDIERDVFFSFSIHGDSLNKGDVENPVALHNMDIDLIKSGVGTLYHWDENGTLSRKLGQGNYTLDVRLWVASFNYSFTDEDAELFIKNGVNVDAYMDIEESKQWYLNGSPVDLEDYGISLNSEPTNGSKITLNRISYMQPSEKLMPSIYRESNTEERFYNAKNNTYTNTETDSFFEFENEFVEGKPKEHIVTFDDIKPTIVGMTNADGLRIDMFTEFAYDVDDNDEIDSEGNYIHPYIFGKLRKFDGEHDFNLFEHAIEEDEMVISMTSGSCGACEWIIGVDEDTQENLVQVDNNGNLVRDEYGNVRCGRKIYVDGEWLSRPETAQAIQNDTRTSEVWIALKKDINTFGVVMPNATHNYKPKAEDTFVILHIELPDAYILAAEKRLDQELLKYMAMNNSEKFTFSVGFSRIFFAENPDILELLDENSKITIEYDGLEYSLYVSSYSYNMTSDKPLPEIKVELSDSLSVSQTSLQNALSDVKMEIITSINVNEAIQNATKGFIKKDAADTANGHITFENGATVKGELNVQDQAKFGEFTEGESGAGVYKDENGNWHIEADFFNARKRFTAKEVVVETSHHVGGQQLLTASGCTFDYILDKKDVYRCYFLKIDAATGKQVTNRWKPNDQAYCNTFNLADNEGSAASHYYWRLVTATSNETADELTEVEFDDAVIQTANYHFVDLSKTVCGAESDAPQALDDVVQLGYQGTDDASRQNAIIMAGAGEGSPYIYEFVGINSFSMPEPEIKLKPGDNVLSGVVRFQQGSTGWQNMEGLPEEIQQAAQFGKDAQDTANNAQSAANNAQSSADNAQNAAQNAQTSADEAKESAGNAQTAADKAQETADEAKNAAENANNALDNLECGKNNLLRNTGFTGDYVTAELTGGSSLKDTSEMYSPNLKYWEATYATAQESDVSESGKEVSILAGGSLQQTLFYKIIADESYVFSWRGKGGTVTFIVGGMTFSTVMTDTWAKYDVKFKAASEGTIFSLSVSGDSVLCELQLERGTVRSAWGICPLDNRSELAKYESLTYLQNLLKGETMVNGAVLSTGQILMGHYDEEGNYTKTTAGVSGVYNDDHSAAFWAGGNLEDAIFTIATYLDNPSYQPTDEELAMMAKCVITHGGRAILNDIILRGYIYALGGYFKGEVNAEKGVFKNIVSPNDGFKIDEAGNAEFTSGTIGSFDIVGGYLGLKSEGANGLDTASKMALTGDSIIFNESPRQVIIGTSRQYAYHYLGKFQDTRENTTAHNVGLEFNIQNSVLGNHAFKGVGSGSLNGVICGYAVQNISWSQENEYKGIDMKLGNHIVARCNYSGAKLTLPTRGSVCDALGIGANEEFAVPLTIVTSASTSGYTIYGRTPEIAELSGEAFPILYGNNYNQELGVLTTQGDTRHYLLTYTNGVYEAFTIGYRD